MAVVKEESYPTPFTLDHGLRILAIIIARDFAKKKEALRKSESDGNDKK